MKNLLVIDYRAMENNTSATTYSLHFCFWKGTACPMAIPRENVYAQLKKRALKAAEKVANNGCDEKKQIAGYKEELNELEAKYKAERKLSLEDQILWWFDVVALIKCGAVADDNMNGEATVAMPIACALCGRPAAPIRCDVCIGTFWCNELCQAIDAVRHTAICTNEMDLRK